MFDRKIQYDIIIATFEKETKSVRLANGSACGFFLDGSVIGRLLASGKFAAEEDLGAWRVGTRIFAGNWFVGGFDVGTLDARDTGIVHGFEQLVLATLFDHLF